MDRVEVVVAAMNQKDLSLYEKMNVNTDLIIANQANSFSYQEKLNRTNCIKMVTSDTRGVGLNRNIGLQFASADILLLSDEDIIYHTGYEKTVLKAFEEIPEADVIIFQMRFVKDNEVFDVDTHKTRRLHLWNGLSFGTYQIAIRKAALERVNMHFTHLFGGGCIYSAGEDSLFLIDCFRKGLKVFSYDGLIGDNIRDSSSWFKGFNEKFFYDRGAFAACAVPKLKFFLCIYYMYAYRNVHKYSFKKKFNLILEGTKGYSKLQTFIVWEELNNE